MTTETFFHTQTVLELAILKCVLFTPVGHSEAAISCGRNNLSVGATSAVNAFAQRKETMRASSISLS